MHLSTSCEGSLASAAASLPPHQTPTTLYPPTRSDVFGLFSDFFSQISG